MFRKGRGRVFWHGVGSVLPLLSLICVGFCIAKLSWCGRRGMNFLSKLNMNVAIPPYLFYTVVRAYSNPEELARLFYDIRYPAVLMGVGLAMATPAAVLLRIRPPQRGIFINAAALTNTVLMGMPVALTLFGEGAMPAIMIFYGANTIIFWTVGVWFLRRDLHAEGEGAAASVKRIFSSRPLVAFLLGVAWVALRLPMPDMAGKVFVMFGAIVTPVSMLFIGCVIRFSSFASPPHLRELLSLLAYRYIVTPPLTGLLCWLLPMDPMMKKVFFLLCNMPAMAQMPLVAKEVGSDYETASMTTAATTALSMVTVPLHLYVMNATGFLSLYG